MDLYNVLGQHMHLPDREWQAILDVAREFGWEPSGTLPPPRSFGLTGGPPDTEPWTGGYLPAMGQALERADAKRLSDALMESTGGDYPAREIRLLSDLAVFCADSGFLLCEEPAYAETAMEIETRSGILALASRLSQPGAQASEQKPRRTPEASIAPKR